MPTVPLVSTTTIEPRSGGGGGYLSVGGQDNPETFGAGIGRAQQQLGSTIQQTGDVFAKHAMALQDRANQAQANDMFVAWDKDASEAGAWYRSQSGIKAVEAYPQYIKRLEDSRDKFLRSIENVEVRRMFDQDTKRRMGFMISDGGYYAGNQNKQYNIAQSKARQEMGIQHAANSAGDAEFRNSLADVKIGAANEAEELGLPPDQRELHTGNAVSRAYASRIASIALTDPFRAKDFYEKNKDQVTNPEVRLQIERNLQQQYVSVGTRSDKDSIVNGTPFKSFPNIGGTYREAISSVESGSREGNYKAQGPVVESGRYAGQRAIGRYQVMEGNIGPWTKEVLGKEMTPQEFMNDSEAQDKVFDAKFGQLVEKYGSFQDAASAWHSGRPLAQAAAAGATDGYSRTTDYVRRATAALAGGQGPLTPNSGPEWLKGAVDRAREIAKVRSPDNPQYEDTLVNRVKSEYNNVKSMQTEIDRGHYNVLIEATMQENEVGRPALTSMSTIMDDPKLSAAYNELAPAKQEAIRKRVERNSKADVSLTPERWNRFQELKGQAVTDPKAFAEVDLGNEDLPRTLTGQLFNQQRQLQKNIQENYGMTRAISSVTPMLNDAGIRRSASDPATAARYNQFVGAFQAERDQWIKDNGGKLPNDKENQAIAAQVLSTQVESSWVPQWMGGAGWNSERKQFEIPSGELEEIDKDLKDAGIPITAPNRYRLYQHRVKKNAAQ